MDLLISAAPWIKAAHVVSVIAWMAGMLYLPRLFVYHCQVDRGSAQADLFIVMERRLMRAIINPAMIASFVFGILLLGTPAEQSTYPQARARSRRSGSRGLEPAWSIGPRAGSGSNWRGQRFYRRWNAVMMVAIVVMVVVRPF